MTPDPSCCVPGDSVAIAAQIMKREDVGPVVVVSDYSEKRLVGMVTDRDLVLKILAAGRSPHDTRVDEAMSANPVSCNENDSVDEAMRKMSTHQVRRIPVVDDSHRLVGIIAQADIARRVAEEDVGALVEDISQPYGEGEWSGGGLGRTALTPVLIGALCFGAGLGVAYLMSHPGSGSRSDSGF